MNLELTGGGIYFVEVDESKLSVYVRFLSNEVIRIDDENPYTFYQYLTKGIVGTPGTGPNPNPTSADGSTIMSAPSDSTADTTPATSYGYALDGRRVGKAGAVNMKYLYDGENVVYELWDDKVVRFTHPAPVSSGCIGCGPGNDLFFTDHPISISIDGVKYYYLYDGLGSVTELIDANQNMVNYYRYTPFGDALVREEQVYNPHQYTGRQYDGESGLYHYRARAYSADIGRFMQQDPAGMVDGANMYAYVGNNPVNGVDPSGMKCKRWDVSCKWCMAKCALRTTIALALIVGLIAIATTPPVLAAITGGIIGIMMAVVFGLQCAAICKKTASVPVVLGIITATISMSCALIGTVSLTAGVVCIISTTVILGLARWGLGI